MLLVSFQASIIYIGIEFFVDVIIIIEYVHEEFYEHISFLKEMTSGLGKDYPKCPQWNLAYISLLYPPTHFLFDLISHDQKMYKQ